MDTVQIQFELPAYAAHAGGLEPSSPSRSAQQMLALFLYEHGKVSLGRACELGGMTAWEFSERARAHGVPVNLASDDIDGDLSRLRNLV
jgi:predicted HTH domain antitoxin